MTPELAYPFDWEAHAAEQLQRQEDEALAEAARKNKEEAPRHPLDTKLVAIMDVRESQRWMSYKGLFWTSDISQADMTMYLEQFWGIRVIIWEGRLMTDAGIEYFAFDPGDWIVLFDDKQKGGFPLSAEEFARRYVREE